MRQDALILNMKKKSKKKETNRFLKVVRNVLVVLFLFSIGSVVLFRFVPVPFTPLMVRNYCAALFNDRKTEFHHTWVSYDEISEHLKTAVVASEDQLFYEHCGFDTRQIKKAIEERRSGKRKRGGSTISQQTAKNVFTFCSRTWLRKGVEAYYTILIELLWSKGRILEVYLNSIEMGPGIYGAEAVAQEHFGCSAKQLTRKQSALIAATLPAPHKFSSKNPSKYMRKRQQQILRQMKNMGK